MVIRLFERTRTYTIKVLYSLYLYFLAFSLRNTSVALELFKDQNKIYVAIWESIQRFGTTWIYKSKKSILILINETIIQIGSKHFLLWTYLYQTASKICTWIPYI
ncbi:MAG: hypothetical protein ACE5SW_08350 [Nitrososphaeraceae archaeon]